MRVELDIFSGRVNPSWALTATQVEEFKRALHALPRRGDEVQGWDGLGYRGLIVSATDDVCGFDEVTLCNEVITTRRGGRLEWFIDHDRLLERTLLQTGRGHIDDTLLVFAQNALTT
jgi:hypothetical protein